MWGSHIKDLLIHIMGLDQCWRWYKTRLKEWWRSRGLEKEKDHSGWRGYFAQFHLLANFTTQSLTLVRNPSWSLLKWSAASMLRGSSKLSRSEKSEERPQSTSLSRLENMFQTLNCTWENTWWAPNPDRLRNVVEGGKDIFLLLRKYLDATIWYVG